MTRASILEITKREGGYSFILTPAGKPWSGAAECACPVNVHPQALAAFCRDIKAAVDAANKDPLKANINTEPFVVAGGGLFLTLLPNSNPLIRELLNALRRLRTPLLIKTDDSSVFWELLFDHASKKFFGLRFNMSRCLRTRGLPSAAPRRREEWRWLMVASPRPDEKHGALPQAAREAARLRDWLIQRNVEYLDYLEGPEATFDSVLGALARHEYDVIHYAGHTDIDRKANEFGLVLHDGRLFPASSIRAMVRGNPIVFLNGCWTASAKGLENSQGTAEGLTDAFLAAGAQLVVGSLFEAPDVGARALAEKFYEAVFQGKAVGEAMRIARLHVLEKSEYGPTWACFVMYGDPCLRFNLREDTLQALLQSVSLAREGFEPACLRVIEQALEYGSGGGLVGTPHLFAALVDGEDRRVRNCLREQGVPPDKLRDAFTEAFEELGSPKQKRSKMALSDNAEDILKHAQSVAKAKGRVQISETDLIEGFVHKHGGTTGEILNGLGVNVTNFLDELGGAAITEGQTRPCPTAGTASFATRSLENQGALNEADYSPEGWAVLIRAVDLARSSGSQLVGTPHFFWGMLQNPEGALAKALHRLGIQIAKKELGINGKGHRSIPLAGPPIQFSQSVTQILILAKTNAQAGQRPRVTEQDLLAGFVQQGGGTVGQLLHQKGLLLQALISELFLDSGGLDLNRLAPEVCRVFDLAEGLGRQKGHQVVGRHHLLYGLLQAENGLLPSLLRKQGQDVERLADLVYAGLPSNVPTTVPAGKPVLALSTGLVRVLCAAETETKQRQQTHIGEKHLVRSLLTHASEDIGSFLVQHGVRWRKLLADLEA